MAVTAIVNQKGGVGKTTVTLGLAAVLAASGRSVLVVDLDPQANATTGAGVWNPGVTMVDVLDAEEEGVVARAITEAGWSVKVHVAPSAPGLARLEGELASDPIGGHDRLAVAMANVRSDYDHVLIDCAPSLGLLTINALFASDDVVIVAEPAAWSLDGVEQILRNVSRVASRRGGSPRVRGIAVNKLARTRDSVHWNDELRQTHPTLEVAPPVRLRAVISEAAAHCLPITEMTRSGAQEAVAEFTAVARALSFAPVDAGATTETRDATGPGVTIAPDN